MAGGNWLIRSFIICAVLQMLLRLIKSCKVIWKRRVARVAEMRNAYNNLVVKSVGKRPLGTSGCTREDNIRKDLRKTEREYVGWMHLAQDRYQWPAVVNTVMNLGVP